MEPASGARGRVRAGPAVQRVSGHRDACTGELLRCNSADLGRDALMTAINAVTDLTIEGDIGVLTINSPPVNALSADVRDGIAGGMAAAVADARSRRSS